MKPAISHFNYAILFLTVIIVFIQEVKGFSYIMLPSDSGLQFCGLVFFSDIQVISYSLMVSGLFLFIFFNLGYNFNGRIGNVIFDLKQMQPIGSSVLYSALKPLDSRINSLKSNPAVSLTTREDENTDQGVVMISSGIILFANKEFFKLTGYEPLEIFGKDFASFIHPESLLSYTMLSRRPVGELKISDALGLITKSNTNVVARLDISQNTEFNPDGVNIFYLKQDDFPKPGQSSKDLFFFDAVENLDSFYLIWDEKGVIYANDFCRKNLPFSLGMIIRKPGLMLKSIRKEDRRAVRIALNEYFLTGKFNEEICCRLQNGELKYYKVKITSKEDDSTRSRRNVATACDITAEKYLIMKAEADALNAETANENKTAFLANMSHEIRSPLNGIIGFSELLADSSITDDERDRYLTIIQNNGNSLITILTDMIDISKLEAGKLEIIRKKFVPALLMDELKCQYSGVVNGKSGVVSVIFSGNEDFRELEIDSDQNRIRQILVNLINNALKFTPSGRIEIGADFSGEDMLFWVKDSGIGVPYENQQSIFERYRQVDSPDSMPSRGFGLGLAISKALAELLGGNLWVESIPGRGSLFTFSIKTNITNNNMETTRSINYPFDFKEHTILIVEDTDFSFVFIEAVLNSTGIRTIWAKNGKEAIEYLKTNQAIDLIMMDMHMPVMNGFEASEIISKLWPDVPIIAQTAFAFPEDVKKCYLSGCSGYIAKPFRRNQLLSTLFEYLENKGEHIENGPVFRKQVC
ncbi:MAG: ATP-binding protein [Bacteroidota bacterium]